MRYPALLYGRSSLGKRIPGRLLSNRGIFFELTAVIVFVVLVVVFAVGYDAGYVKLVAVRTRRVVEQACKGGARHLPIVRSAVGAARYSLYSAVTPDLADPLVGVTVNSFQIIVPTAPGVGGVNSGSPAVLTPQTLNTCAGTPSVCTFVGDIESPAVLSLFPKDFLSRRNFNDAIACKADVSVNTLMSGTKSVSVTVAWETKQIGAAYPAAGQPVIPGLPSERSQIGGGLIVVVDPTMTTRTSDANTRFTNTIVVPQIISDKYNPIRVLINPVISLDAFGGTRPASGKKLVPTPPLPGMPLGGNPRTERAHACMNLPIAVRNRFLVGIVGRARGWLRDKLAIYVANPYHRYARDHFEEGFLPAEPNSPSIMVQGGIDTMRPVFRLPYVRYGVGDKGTTELNPFSDNPSLVDAEKDRLLMGQLADCFHLYGRLDRQGIERVADPAINNYGYETDDVAVTSLGGSLTSVYSTASSSAWDQEAGGVGTADDNLKSAEQVVSMLGSVQICPHGGGAGGGPACDESGGKPPNVIDPNLPTQDLRGDLRGALMAVNGGRIMPDGTIVPFFAYRPDAVPGEIPSESVFSKYASVLVVLSRRLGEDEVPGIQEQVNIFRSSPALGRRIIVAYFPVTDEDRHSDAIQRIRTAFLVSPPAGTQAYSYPSETENLLFVFQPGIPPMTVKQYWARLLGEGENGMSGRTRNIFSYLFTPSPKL